MSDGGLPSEAVYPCRHAEAAQQAEAAASKIETVEIKVCIHMERGGGNSEGSLVSAESGKKSVTTCSENNLVTARFSMRKREVAVSSLQISRLKMGNNKKSGIRNSHRF